MSQGSLAFGDGALTYPYGGVPMPAIGGFGMNKEVSMFDIVDASGDGLIYRYDQANRKIKVFAPAPPIVYEEKHTIPATPYQVTLDYPAAAILNIASDSACYHVIEPSDTVASGEVQLASAMAKGVRPTLTFHADETTEVIYVTYITQAWADVWNNRVASEEQATATHVATLTNDVIFVESVSALDTNAASVSSRPEILRGGDVATTGECELDYGDKTLTFVDTDAVTDVVVTYIKLPSSGFLADRFLENQDNTIATNVSAALLPVHPILFHGLCGQIPDFHNAGERDPHSDQMLEGDALATAGEFYIKYGCRPATGITGHLLLNDGTTDAVSLTYVWGIPEEIPGIVPLELKDSSIIHATTLKFMSWGR